MLNDRYNEAGTREHLDKLYLIGYYSLTALLLSFQSL